MKKDNIIKVIISVVLIGIMTYLAIFGFSIKETQILPSAKSINTGLDISGGVSIVYQAKEENGIEITEQDLKKSEAVIRKRLEGINIFDYILRSDSQSKKISLEIPANTTDESKDPLKAVEGLDKTAKIEFRDMQGNVLLSGEDIKSAAYSEQATDSTGLRSPHVVLTFSDSGKAKFAEATEKLVGQKLAIYLDEDLITDPVVNSKIDSPTAIITMGQGNYKEKKETATKYAMLIDSGTLPFSLEVINKEYIGPYIGQKALEISVIAAIVGFIIVSILMLVFYRIPGLISIITLICYTALMLIIMSVTRISLTLPGIAGLILSIGMALDANVIIFERLKEELIRKVNPTKAFEISFKKAIGAIVDGNITTFLIAILLYIFGIGPVKGFGIVLALGVMTSMLTAIVINRYILKNFIGLANKHIGLFISKRRLN